MIINDVNFNVELEDILIELKAELNANGIGLLSKMKEGPTHIQVCCPYHNNGQERRPSAGIRKDDGIFHCFACSEVHSLPEVISYCFGHTDDIVGKFGWQWLLKNFATVQVEERSDIKLDFNRFGNSDSNMHSSRTSLSNRNTSFNTVVTEEELDKYRYIHPYMYKRGLTDDIIELFDVGYDAETDCITFPIRDIHGNCLFVARRSVKSKFFNYPEGVEKPLYGLYELYNFAFSGVSKQPFWHLKNYPAEIVVTESMLDALSFWTVGKYAAALNGLGNELQFKQLRELPCRKIILATDMDERGLAARKRIRQNMQNTKIITEYIFPKGRKDANECTKEELMNLKEVF